MKKLVAARLIADFLQQRNVTEATVKEIAQATSVSYSTCNRALNFLARKLVVSKTGTKWFWIAL